MNIIADIAGRYDELMLLLQKMPQGEQVILLGDLNDRGPDTSKVIQWAIDNNTQSVKSNHGDMLIHAYNASNNEKFETVGTDRSDIYLFESNGGYATLFSYGGMDKIPKEHIQYLVDCPWYIEKEGVLLSHAPFFNGFDNYEQACDISVLNRTFLWNRKPPKRREVFQIHGHTTYFQEYKDEDGLYGMCLDNSGNGELRGIHWPSKEIFIQKYI